MELAMNIPTHRHRTLDRLHIPFLHEYGPCLLTQVLHFQLRQRLAVRQLLNLPIHIRIWRHLCCCSPFPLLTTNPPFFLLSNTHFHFRLSTSPGGHNNNSRKINQSREIQRESHENRETLRGFGFPVHLGLGGTTTSVSLLHTCITFLYTRKAEEETVAERRDDDASEEDAKRDQPGNAVVGEGGAKQRHTRETVDTHTEGQTLKNRERVQDLARVPSQISPIYYFQYLNWCNPAKLYL